MNEEAGSAVSVSESAPAAQLQLTADAKRAGDGLEIRYEVTNRGAEPIVLLNLVQRPVAEPGQDVNRVFVEVGEDGVTTITRRAFVEDPPASIPALHSTVLVEADATVSGQLDLPLPLADGAPGATGSAVDTPSRVRLCLGYVPASGFSAAALAEIRTAETRLRAVSPDVPNAQALLCSDVIDVG